MDLLDSVQIRAINIVRRLDHLSSEKRLGELGLFKLTKRKFWGDLMVAFQYLKRPYKKESWEKTLKVCCNRMRGNVFGRVD